MLCAFAEIIVGTLIGVALGTLVVVADNIARTRREALRSRERNAPR